MKEVFASRLETDVIEIYAVLSKNQYSIVQNGEAELELPDGTELSNKAGSRALYITCYGKNAAMELVDGLENSEIPWQEVDHGDNLMDLSNEGANTSHEEASG